jgi:hypothetical protein
MRKTGVYKQGVVETENHPILNKGQFIEILQEKEDEYVVRAIFPNAPMITISKKYIFVN